MWVARSSLLLSLLLAIALFAAVQAQNDTSQATEAQASQPYLPGPIVINEVLPKPANESASLAQTNSWSVITAAVEWVELANRGASEVDLSGWTLVRADKSPDDGWSLPAGVKVPAGGFLVVLCPRSKQALPPIPSAANNVQVAQGLKVSSNGIALYKPDKTLAASTGHLPGNLAGITVGLPQPAPAEGNAQVTYLAEPTPFLVNTAAKAGAGPFIRSLKAKPSGAVAPGSGIAVSVKVRRNQAPIGSVTLLTRVNYEPEQQIPMTAEGEASEKGEVTYTATIPGDKVTAGTMIRWRVQANDTASGSTAEPSSSATSSKHSSSKGGKQKEPKYEGTVVPIAAAEAFASNVSIPVLYWFSDNPQGVISQTGGHSSISFNGSFYDAVETKRRGVTSLSWAKPKLEFKVEDGFVMRPGIPAFTKLKLNSYYFEVGERSFMKEALAYQVMADEGVVAPANQYVQVYLNGKFYGLYGMIEEVGSGMLSRHNLPTDGPMFESKSGELSNLRWDLPLSEMPSYYTRPTRKSHTDEWGLLANLTKGLAGGGPGTRTSFVFDYLNLPALVNENAVQTLLLNQDRCTKNWFVYYNPETKEWSRIPWDVETSFAQDNNLGGVPGPLYCILACEQWNSPLYCDSEHPQDIGDIKTSWGTITAVGLNPYQGAAVPTSGRRLMQQPATSPAVPVSAAAAPLAAPVAVMAAAAPAAPLPAEGTKPLTFPKSNDWANPNRVQYGTKSVIGAAGTYNHLTDALLDVNATRTMYLRRLRTLADKYYGQGLLRKNVDANWLRIKDLAAQEYAVWKVSDGTRGYAQITSEFIPIRGKQLLQTYGPGGADPLLPQDNTLVTLGIDAVQVATPREQSYVALSVRTPVGQAVDVSNWMVTAGSTSWSFPPGTVIPPGYQLHLSPDVAAFRARPTSPKAGEAVFVIQAPDSLWPAAGAASINWAVVDEAGTAIKFA